MAVSDEEIFSHLYCFNPTTGKSDGGYCVWEGSGKCMSCTAADRLKAALQAGSGVTGAIEAKFGSGNSVPVERITITAEEWAALTQGGG